MATKRTPSSTAPKPPMELVVSRGEARQRIQDRIERGLELKRQPVNTRETLDHLSNDYSKWNSYNAELLKRLFTTDEAEKEYSYWGIGAISMREPSLSERIADVHEDIDKKVHRLDSILDRLELIPLSSALTLAQPEAPPARGPRSRRVFVVHGHDEVAKTSLEVFLHENGLEPVVLHRQADEGLTVIEKFEKHSDVGYAFILLTPDEVAYLAADEAKPDDQRKKERRARPNVIFEFGYFVGKLGRSRVCCLYTGAVTLPSDVNGIIYKKYENSIDEVAYSILKDLRASGYGVA